MSRRIEDAEVFTLLYVGERGKEASKESLYRGPIVLHDDIFMELVEENLLIKKDNIHNIKIHSEIHENL